MDVVQVSYGKEDIRVCDVYVCKARVRASAPCVMLVHGGAWVMGKRQSLKSLATLFCQEAGVVCIVPDYRLSCFDPQTLKELVIGTLVVSVVVCLLSPQDNATGTIVLLILLMAIVVCIVVYVLLFRCRQTVSHPAHIQDLQACTQWLVSSEAPSITHNRKLVLFGHSAGAHLCALLSLNPRYLSAAVSERLAGVICMSGVYSFWRLQESISKWFLNRSVFGEHAEGLTRESYHSLHAKHTCGCEEHCQPWIRRWEKVIDTWPMFQLERHTGRKVRFLLTTVDLDFSLVLHAKDFAAALHIRGFDVQHLHFPNMSHFSRYHQWHTTHAKYAKAFIAFLQSVS